MTKDKKKALPLAYVDARTVMERLDSAVGIENWQDKYEFHGDTRVCYLSIRIGGEWITKSDGAGDSAVEKEKGGISDAFKRAAVKWGMGRELYDIKCRWQPVDEWKKLIGDSWDYVIPNAEDDEPEPEFKFDIEAEYALCAKQIDFSPSKAEFVAMWNNNESKERRARIKELCEDYYAELTTKKNTRLAIFDADEKKLLAEFNAA